MQSAIKSSVAMIVSTFAIMVIPQLTQAGADYQVLSRKMVKVGNPSGEVKNPQVFSFTLPDNVNLTSVIRRSAVLQYSVQGTQFSHNEIYVNPPSPGCFSDSADGNQSHSIGTIEDYDANNGILNTTFTVHVTFDNSLLHRGPGNTIVVCSRNESGDTSGNLDDFFIGNIVLYFQTI